MSIDPVGAGISAGAGLLSGLFSDSTPQLPPELQQLYHYLMKLSKEKLAYAHSAPLSLPQEQMALAQSKGLAAQDYQNQRNRLYAGMSNSLNPNGAPGSAPDLLQRFGSNEAAGLSNLDFGAMMQALQGRQNAIGEAAGIAGGAGAAAHSYYQPNEPLSGLFSQLASGIAFQQHAQPGGGGNSTGGGVGAGIGSGIGNLNLNAMMAQPAYQNPYQGPQAGGYGDFNAGLPPVYG
jgi:hypothetical protein